MNARIVTALVAKDFTLFFRNQFFALITGLGIVAYAAIYFLMPGEVDELLKVGVYAPKLPTLIAQEFEEEGLDLDTFDSEEALTDAMLAGDFNVGVAFPPDLDADLAAGNKGLIRVYFTSDFPPDIQGWYTTLFEELGYLAAGQPILVEADEEVLGRDMAGQQIPIRDLMVPLFAVMIVMTETMGMATLISSEVETGTLHALLITPMNIPDLFLGKGITGVSMAFGQAVILMAVTGSLDRQAGVILAALLLGAMLVTGVGFLMASASKDMMNVIAWGVPAIILLSVPAFGVMFPGSVSNWVKVLPSHYLVDTVHQAANFGTGWPELWGNLAILLAFDLVLLALGMAALRRKMQ